MHFELNYEIKIVFMVKHEIYAEYTIFSLQQNLNTDEKFNFLTTTIKMNL